MGRKERMEFQLVFLSLTHTHTLVPSHAYSWLSHMCAQSKALLTHSHLSSCTHMQAHVHTLTRDLPELSAGACLCVGGC